MKRIKKQAIKPPPKSEESPKRTEQDIFNTAIQESIAEVLKRKSFYRGDAEVKSLYAEIKSKRPDVIADPEVKKTDDPQTKEIKEFYVNFVKELLVEIPKLPEPKGEWTRQDAADVWKVQAESILNAKYGHNKTGYGSLRETPDFWYDLSGRTLRDLHERTQEHLGIDLPLPPTLNAGSYDDGFTQQADYCRGIADMLIAPDVPTSTERAIRKETLKGLPPDLPREPITLKTFIQIALGMVRAKNEKLRTLLSKYKSLGDIKYPPEVGNAKPGQAKRYKPEDLYCCYKKWREDIPTLPPFKTAS